MKKVILTMYTLGVLLGGAAIGGGVGAGAFPNGAQIQCGATLASAALVNEKTLGVKVYNEAKIKAVNQVDNQYVIIRIE